MKAFVSALIAALVIAVVAAITLDWFDRSTAEVQQSPHGSVRL